MKSPGQQVPNMLLKISWEITPEKMKRWSQRKNNTQLWMGLVMEERSDAVKSNIAQEPGTLVSSPVTSTTGYWFCFGSVSSFFWSYFSADLQQHIGHLPTYQDGQFIFQYLIFLPFYTFHGVLKARILKWLAISFSSGPRSVTSLHSDPSLLGGPTRHGSQFH